MEKEPEEAMEKKERRWKKMVKLWEKSDDEAMMVEDEQLGAGTYTDYSQANLTDGENVIFFAASWCTTCRALENNLNADLASIPSNLAILKADYDTETALKQQYGVTYQHTLVQVDKEGISD